MSDMILKSSNPLPAQILTARDFPHQSSNEDKDYQCRLPQIFRLPFHSIVSSSLQFVPAYRASSSSSPRLSTYSSYNNGRSETQGLFAMNGAQE